MEDFVREKHTQSVTGADSVHRAYPFTLSTRDLARFGLLFARKGNRQTRANDSGRPRDVLSTILAQVSFLQPARQIKLQLKKELTRSIKRGHPWVYADALKDTPRAPVGSHAVLLDREGRELAWGYYNPESPIALRVCSLEGPLSDGWAQQRLDRAAQLRRSLFDENTTAFRLVNGEGDGLPGLVCDIYGTSAAIKLDGPGPRAFYDTRGIAEYVLREFSLACVYERLEEDQGHTLVGSLQPVEFRENGVRFTADLVKGQKTGFFLDQRDNRLRMGELSDGKRVLNLFSYTGGFSVYAGLGGAAHVTSVDLAEPAIAVAKEHWMLNGLPADRHVGVAADAFKYLEKANTRWDIVISDPPSFAPSEKAVPSAKQAYLRLIASAASVVEPGGLLAASSCSSHVNREMFLDICENAIGQARRRATVLGIYSLPPDHPTPLAFPEFRYLKFVLVRLE